MRLWRVLQVFIVLSADGVIACAFVSCCVAVGVACAVLVCLRCCLLFGVKMARTGFKCI